MSGGRDLLGNLRAAVDAGDEALARYLAALDRHDLEQLAGELARIDGSLREAAALGEPGRTPDSPLRGGSGGERLRLEAIGADDPLVREHGGEWAEAHVAAFASWARERLDEPAELLARLVGPGALDALTVRALVAELIAMVELDELEIEAVRAALARMRGWLAERAVGDVEPAGWDGAARALLLVLLLAWAGGRP